MMGTIEEAEDGEVYVYLHGEPTWGTTLGEQPEELIFSIRRCHLAFHQDKQGGRHISCNHGDRF